MSSPSAPGAGCTSLPAAIEPRVNVAAWGDRWRASSASHWGSRRALRAGRWVGDVNQSSKAGWAVVPEARRCMFQEFGIGVVNQLHPATAVLLQACTVRPQGRT